VLGFSPAAPQQRCTLSAEPNTFFVRLTGEAEDRSPSVDPMVVVANVPCLASYESMSVLDAAVTLYAVHPTLETIMFPESGLMLLDEVGEAASTGAGPDSLPPAATTPVDVRQTCSVTRPHNLFRLQFLPQHRCVGVLIVSPRSWHHDAVPIS
jgi:hypothetical protein